MNGVTHYILKTNYWDILDISYVIADSHTTSSLKLYNIIGHCIRVSTVLYISNLSSKTQDSSFHSWNALQWLAWCLCQSIMLLVLETLRHQCLSWYPSSCLHHKYNFVGKNQLIMFFLTTCISQVCLHGQLLYSIMYDTTMWLIRGRIGESLLPCYQTRKWKKKKRRYWYTWQFFLFITTLRDTWLFFILGAPKYQDRLSCFLSLKLKLLQWAEVTFSDSNTMFSFEVRFSLIACCTC